MEISKRVHQIKIEFYVTPKILRYVYLYLLLGNQSCCLIDAGTAGSEAAVADYMEGLGRSLTEVKTLLLTHAHPDHMGGAAALKRLSGCRIYASGREREWIEHIDVQYRERPIPGFYRLTGESVLVDRALEGGERLVPEPGMTLRVLKTPGHSDGSLSYVWEEEGILFCGDAVPAPDEGPIFTDEEESEASLRRLIREKDIRFCCPAWDRVYGAEELEDVLKERLRLLQRLKACVREIAGREQGGSLTDQAGEISERMGFGEGPVNPLFFKSIRACMPREYREEPRETEPMKNARLF